MVGDNNNNTHPHEGYMPHAKPHMMKYRKLLVIDKMKPTTTFNNVVKLFSMNVVCKFHGGCMYAWTWTINVINASLCCVRDHNFGG